MEIMEEDGVPPTTINWEEIFSEQLGIKFFQEDETEKNMNINVPEFKYYLKEMYKCIEDKNESGEHFFLEKMNDIWFGSSEVERREMDRISLEEANKQFPVSQKSGTEFKIKF